MPDPRMLQLANLLVHYCTDVQPGNWVVVRGHVAALPLMQEVVREVVRTSGNPTVLLDDEGVQEAMLAEAGAEQLAWLPPHESLIAERADVRISIGATSNTRALTNIAPERMQALQRARRPLQQLSMERAAAGDFRWVGTLFPCAALAQEADMSLRDYEDFVYTATFADTADPVSAWRAVHERQQRWVEWLRGKSEVIVRGPNVDLRLSIAGRTFVNSDGRRNMPSGEIFTGPVEESVEGWVRFDFPAIRSGRIVEGVELTFARGEVVQATARVGEAFLRSQIEADAGARYLGEFAVGTNDRIQRFTRNILFDEKIGGTMHVALGAGYPETGSRNQSAIHWDFICDMRGESEIIVDGEVVYRDGRFVI